MIDSTATPLSAEERIASLEQIVTQLATARAANADSSRRERFKRHLPSVALGAVAAAFLCAAGVAIASRNSSGTMSAINGPYVAGTVISAPTVNTRFSDVESEITDSLSRSGKGGMSAALRGTDGTKAAPALSFTSETGSGLYRNGSNDVRMSVNATDVAKCTATGCSFPAGINANTTINSGFSLGVGGAQDATVQAEILAAGSQWSGSNLGQNLIIKGSRNNAIGIFDSAGANPWAISNAGGILFATMPALSDSASAITQYFKVSTSGVAIGATGTAISASYGGSTTTVGGLLGSGACATPLTITTTGSASGAPCSLGFTTAVGAGPYTIQCDTSTANSCIIRTCNNSGGNITFPANTLYCRVFNP